MAVVGVPVHPRACGEHGNYAFLLAFMRGSSPRLRGTYAHKAEPPASYRFIPAPAGNIIYNSLLVASDPVHPRACGEHDRYPAGGYLVDGSSPRLRGT